MTTVPLRRLLVAVKNIGKATPALRKAAQLAQSAGSELLLVHVIADPVYVGQWGGSDAALGRLRRERENEAKAGLESLAQPLRKRGLKVSTSVDWDFPVGEAIVRRAISARADLIVSQAHEGAHDLPRLLRLADWELLRISPLPVLLVKKSGSYRRPTVLAALDPLHANAKPAKLDEQILRSSGTIVSALRGKLIALHAFLPAPLLPYGKSAVQKKRKAVTDLKYAEATSARIEQVLKRANADVSEVKVVMGHPDDVIPDMAGKYRADIVAMGALSRSGLKAFFVGNTAERVIDRVDADLLIVKPANLRMKPLGKPRGMRIVPMPSLVG